MEKYGWRPFTNGCLLSFRRVIWAHVKNVRHRRRVLSGVCGRSGWDGARLQTSAFGYGDGDSGTR